MVAQEIKINVNNALRSAIADISKQLKQYQKFKVDNISFELCSTAEKLVEFATKHHIVSNNLSANRFNEISKTKSFAVAFIIVPVEQLDQLENSAEIIKDIESILYDAAMDDLLSTDLPNGTDFTCFIRKGRANYNGVGLIRRQIPSTLMLQVDISIEKD